MQVDNCVWKIYFFAYSWLRHIIKKKKGLKRKKKLKLQRFPKRFQLKWKSTTKFSSKPMWWQNGFITKWSIIKIVENFAAHFLFLMISFNFSDNRTDIHLRSHSSNDSCGSSEVRCKLGLSRSSQSLNCRSINCSNKLSDLR